jgi:hypothetical protein
MSKKNEPTLIIPETIDRERSVIDFSPSDLCIYIPLPNTKDKGIYVDRSGYVALLRANKENAEAVQYLADMLE